MKHAVRILLTLCFVSTLALFLSGRPLSAQEEETRPDESAEFRAQNEDLRRQNEELRKVVENLRLVLEQMKLQVEDAKREMEMRAEDVRSRAEEEAQKKVIRALEADEYKNLMAALQEQLQAKEKTLMALDFLRATEDKQVKEVAEQSYKVAEKALNDAMKALDELRVPEKAEEMLQELIEKGRKPDVTAARKVLEDLRKVKQRQVLSKERLAEALGKYEDALRQTTPQQLAEVMRDRLLSQVYKETKVNQKAQKLEKAILSGDDAGLLLQLRLEKIDLCRKLGKLDEAVDELNDIIEENLDPETTNAARWTLIEVLQEQKQTEDALDLLKEIVATSKSAEERRSALYAMIEMAGDDPEARLRATDDMIEWLQEVAKQKKEAIGEAREEARRAKCINNLSQLMLGIRTWTQDHDEKFPENLSDLHPGYVPTLDVFTCPSAGGSKIEAKEDIDSKTSYIYVKGLTEAAPPDTVVIYDDPSNHRGEGGHVAFHDGHVRWFSAKELSKIVERGRQQVQF